MLTNKEILDIFHKNCEVYPAHGHGNIAMMRLPKFLEVVRSILYSEYANWKITATQSNPNLEHAGHYIERYVLMKSNDHLRLDSGDERQLLKEHIAVADSYYFTDWSSMLTTLKEEECTAIAITTRTWLELIGRSEVYTYLKPSAYFDVLLRGFLGVIELPTKKVCVYTDAYCLPNSEHRLFPSDIGMKYFLLK